MEDQKVTGQTSNERGKHTDSSTQQGKGDTGETNQGGAENHARRENMGRESKARWTQEEKNFQIKTRNEKLEINR